MDYSQNGCYLTVVRPPVKSVKHCVTGQCEVSRVCSQNNHQALEYSIKHSKMLQQYKEMYPANKPFELKQGELLCSQKNITDNQTKFYVIKVLRELHSVQFSLSYLTSLQKTKYSKDNQTHQNMLLEIWKNLKPEEKLTHRISDQWISVGFQANDPATDFRGAGFLGLVNLNRLSSTALGKTIFQTVLNTKTEYFFCSTGLAFTMLCLQLLRNNHLESNFWVSDSEEETLTQFQNLYQLIFFEFDAYWREECEDKSIMQFNVNLKNFQRKILALDGKLLKVKVQKIMEQ